MKPNRIARASAFTLALLMTLGMLGGIDQLAGQADASAYWAAAVMSKRG